MKLSTLVICVFLVSVLLISVGAGYRNVIGRDKQIREKRNQVETLKFINRSFEKTCEGNGFIDLFEWQKVCRACFELDYIGWSSSEEFMIDNSPEKGTLWYGKWIGQGTEGEIYFRDSRRRTDE